MRYGRIVATVAVFWAGAAHAERDLCADRPGIGTQACTLDPGKAQVETSLADWSRSRDADRSEDQTLIGDTLVRYGLGDATELRFGWTAYGFDRTRDRADGSADHRHGTGDIGFAVKQNLAHPDGKGLSVALLPFVTAPTGHAPIGATTWGTGLIVPVTLEVDDDWSLGATSEIDAAPDEEAHHRHLAYSAALDLNRKLDENLTLSAEGFVRRDRDPSGHETLASANLLGAYQIGENRQIDLSIYKGLNHQTPRVELIVGVAYRF